MIAPLCPSMTSKFRLFNKKRHGEPFKVRPWRKISFVDRDRKKITPACYISCQVFAQHGLVQPAGQVFASPSLAQHGLVQPSGQDFASPSLAQQGLVQPAEQVLAASAAFDAQHLVGSSPQQPLTASSASPTAAAPQHFDGSEPQHLTTCWPFSASVSLSQPAIQRTVPANITAKLIVKSFLLILLVPFI